MSYNVKEELKNLLSNRESDIKDWIEEKSYGLLTPVYSSVDMRFSGAKFVPVDYNIFPAGFNNLSEESIAIGSINIQHYLQRFFPNVHHIGLITEYHTRNQFYQLNVECIVKIIENAGYKVSTAPLTEGVTIDEDLPPTSFITNNQGRIAINNTCVDLVLLNNDLSAGFPALLTDAVTPVIPSTKLGWYIREKSQYFTEHQKIIIEFCTEFGLDPFYLTSNFLVYNGLNFQVDETINGLADKVEILLEQLFQSYKNYGLNQDPYLLVKANSGTYGMGIMVIKNAKEMREVNKKNRHRMQKIKSGRVNNSVIIQEGIESIDKIDKYSAEPMAYLIGNEVIGNFWRVNPEATSTDNLNSRGMYFTKSTYSAVLTVENLVAKLAHLAAVREYNTLYTS